MSARPSGAGASALAALLAATALLACGDTTRIAAPTAATPTPRAAALRAADTSYLPAARVRARTLAIALADPAARARLRDALRRSTLATHRLTMESELGRPRSAALVGALARAAAIADDSLRALFARGPALDLFLPRTSDRRGWRPAAPLAVAVADRQRAAPRVVYAASGDSSVAVRAGAYLVLTPAGDRSRRVGAQRDVAGDAVEDGDDRALSGTLTFLGPRGDTTRIDVADLIADYRTLPASAPAADRERVLGELRAERAAFAPRGGPRRLVACTDVCDGGTLVGWKDTTYLVAFYERGQPEAGGDATFEPWYDGYYRGNRWRVQFNGVAPNTIVFVDVPFMSIRQADHSAATIKVIGGEDEGSWSDGACVASGMRFAGARYTRNPGTLAVSLTKADTYTWRHCGAWEDADLWGAQLRWTPRSRPAAATLRVEFDTLYMSATSVDLPGLQAVQKYQGAYRYGYTGCPSVYYIVGSAADGEPLDTTSLSVLATTTSGTPGVAEPSRPMNGILRDYAQGTATLTASLDGVTAQGTIGVIPFITGIAVSPAQTVVGPGTTAVERVSWTGSATGRCPMAYRNVAALRPTWSASSPALSVALGSADSSVAWATPTAVGSFTLWATIGPFRAQAAVVGELAPTAAPVARGTFTTSGASVSWSAVTGARSYTIYRRADGGGWQLYGSTTSTVFVDPTPIDFAYGGASPGTAGTEDFAVAATNYGGTGPLSNAVGFQLSAASGGTGDGGGGTALFSRRPVVRPISP